MPIRVLIVDDSRFICNRIKEILEEEQDFHVVGFASDGQQAVLSTAELEPDVITMDIEMPVMDGISAVKKIMEDCPTAILMFSASTHKGAKATFDALNAGAIDFLPKQLDNIDDNRDTAKQLLRRRVREVARQNQRIRFALKKRKAPTRNTNLSATKETPGRQHSANTNQVVVAVVKKVKLLVIVASTGGPVAIQKVLAQVSVNCSFPILIVQHMPKKFSKSFAERLDQICHVSVKEAENNDELLPGQALLVPGGSQLEIKKRNSVCIREKQKDEIYAPCADITLSSIAQEFSGNVLTIVLTGMGSDGKEGAKKMKQKGFAIWAQDEQSSTIYGMPKAVVEANLADNVFSLNEIANQLQQIS